MRLKNVTAAHNNQSQSRNTRNLKGLDKIVLNKNHSFSLLLLPPHIANHYHRHQAPVQSQLSAENILGRCKTRANGHLTRMPYTFLNMTTINVWFLPLFHLSVGKQRLLSGFVGNIKKQIEPLRCHSEIFQTIRISI